MNKEELFQYILHPESLDRESLPLLNDLVKQFPYCQTTRLLLVKCLQNENNFQFSEALKTTAAFVTDRKVLYHLLKELEQVNKPEIITVHKIEQAVQVRNSETSFPVDSNVPPATEISSPKILSPQEILARRLQEIQNEKTDSKKHEILPDNPEQNKRLVVKKEQTILDSQFIDNQIKDALIGEVKVEEKILSEKSQISLTKTEPPPETRHVEKKEKHSFNEWLRIKHSVKMDLVSGKAKTQHTIIAKFLSDEPKLSPPKTEFYNPANMAKISVEEHFDFISETLAKIYFDQGSYQKALTAYEKLSLQYPEKSAIFAAQIKAIQQIITEK